MSKLTQGTHVFFIDPTGSTPVVVRLRKIVNFNPGTAPATQIDETTLEDLLFMEFRSGLRNPGQGNMMVNIDPDQDSHVTLHEISQLSPAPKLKWAVGWSDGTDEPTVDSNGDFDLPTTRTWNFYDASVADFPFNWDTDTIVKTEIGLQRSGGMGWQRKGAA